MAQVQYPSFPGEPSGAGPRPFGEIPSLWTKVTQMTEDWLAQEAPRASGSNTLVGVLIYAVAAAIFTPISTLINQGVNNAIFGSQAGDMPGISGGETLALVFCCSILIAPLAFYIINGLNYLAAVLLGGKGAYSTQAYLVSLFYVPLGLVGLLASLIPCLGALVSLAVGIYYLVLNVRAMKVVHNLTTGRALVSVLWPVVLALFLACCGVLFALILAGPAIGTVFSNIVPGIATPVP